MAQRRNLLPARMFGIEHRSCPWGTGGYGKIVRLQVADGPTAKVHDGSLPCGDAFVKASALRFSRIGSPPKRRGSLLASPGHKS